MFIYGYNLCISYIGYYIGGYSGYYIGLIGDRIGFER